MSDYAINGIVCQSVFRVRLFGYLKNGERDIQWWWDIHSSRSLCFSLDGYCIMYAVLINFWRLLLTLMTGNGPVLFGISFLWVAAVILLASIADVGSSGILLG